MYKDKTLCVVIPAYNEELLIAETIRSVPDFVDRVYVVNDCSTDRTEEIVLSFNHHRIFPITHSRNRGVGAAIVTGYQRALRDEVDIAVVMAGDNQMDPSHLEALIAPIVEGRCDYSKGDRLSRRGHQIGMSPWRRFGNWQLTWMTRIAMGNWRIKDPQNGYTAITREALQRINLDRMYPGYGYCNDLLVKLAVSRARIVDIPMPARYGREKSKIRYGRYIPKVSWLLLRAFVWRIKMTLGRVGSTAGKHSRGVDA